jgi:hypothetical protein
MIACKVSALFPGNWKSSTRFTATPITDAQAHP